MKSFKGRTLSWELADGVLELELHRESCNEIGSAMLEELEKFAAALEALTNQASPAPEGASALVIHSSLKLLEELEKFAAALEALTNQASPAPEGASALVIHSSLKAGFSAGADL